MGDESVNSWDHWILRMTQFFFPHILTGKGTGITCAWRIISTTPGIVGTLGVWLRAGRTRTQSHPSQMRTVISVKKVTSPTTNSSTCSTLPSICFLSFGTTCHGSTATYNLGYWKKEKTSPGLISKKLNICFSMRQKSPGRTLRIIFASFSRLPDYVPPPLYCVFSGRKFLIEFSSPYGKAYWVASSDYCALLLDRCNLKSIEDRCRKFVKSKKLELVRLSLIGLPSKVAV